MSFDELKKYLNENFNNKKQGPDEQNKKHILEPTDKMDIAPIIDKETAFEDKEK